MNTGTRNHLSSICHNYVKHQHPEDYKILQKLAETNYTANGPKFTISTLLREFSTIKQTKETTEVL